MAVTFTHAAFEEFCTAIAAWPVYPVERWLSTEPSPQPPCVILRFDVDYREAHALELATIAARHGIHGSFYFRHQADGFDFPVIERIHALGHEIGYHFETLDTAQGDVDRAAVLFLDHLADLRAAGFTVRTVAAHGSRPTAPTYRANLDLLVRRPELIAQAGLLGETTLSIDFARMTYVSDANWRWRRYEHYQPGITQSVPTTLRAMVTTLPRMDSGLYITFHPQQWYTHPGTMWLFRAGNWLRRRWSKWAYAT